MIADETLLGKINKTYYILSLNISLDFKTALQVSRLVADSIVGNRGNSVTTVKKKKTGGRKKGTPNRVTLDLIQTLTDMGHEPAAHHVKIFNEAMKNYEKKKKAKNDWGANGALDTAQKANAELMKYTYPTRKAVEHSGPNGSPIGIKTFNDLVNLLGVGDANSDGSEGEDHG